MSHVPQALDDEAKVFLEDIHVHPRLFAGLESCQLFSKNLLQAATRRCLYRAFTGPVATDIYFKIHPVQALPISVQTTLISAGIPTTHFSFLQKLDMGCSNHALLRISATEDNLVDVGCPRGAARTLAEMIRQYFVKQDQLQAKDAAGRVVWSHVCGFLSICFLVVWQCLGGVGNCVCPLATVQPFSFLIHNPY